MGKIHILTDIQKKVLSLVAKEPKICQEFYFTGGTVLSAYYLEHRYSDDIDLFSEKPISPEFLFPIISSWAKLLDATVQTQFIDDRMYVCIFTFTDDSTLKVDFCYYPYPRLKEGTTKEGIAIDSLFDIAVNKFVTVVNRASAKDFVDLYFLYSKFGYWDLAHGAEEKFKMSMDPVLFGSDLMAVDELEDLPNMVLPLTLPQLKEYFIAESLKLVKHSVVE